MDIDARHTNPVLHWQRSGPLLGLVGLLAAAWQGIIVARAVRQGRRLAQAAQRFQANPLHAQASVLVLGDSTGVGVGSGAVGASLPGLLAAEFPQVRIVNACANGARVADTLQQLQAHVVPGQRFDLVLVLAGGNDVLKLTPARALAGQAQALLAALRAQAAHVVWLGSADIGTAPVLKPPLSWASGWKCRKTMQQLRQVVCANGADFIDFCASPHTRRFATQPARYFASDGLHPSAASYRHCFEELKRRAPLARLLVGAARA